MSQQKRNQILVVVKIAEKCGRHTEMFEYMKKIIELGIDLTPEERNLFGLSIKNIISPLRQNLIKIREKEDHPLKESHFKTLLSYRKKMENELEAYCHSTLNCLTNHLIPVCQIPENKTFYLKMKGDCWRYLAEVAKGDQQIFQRCAKEAILSYQDATDLACCELQATDPIRLGLCLNYSTFLHDFCKKEMDACRLSKTAYDDAVAELNQIQDEDAHKNACLILQKLKDNLCDWVGNISVM